MVRKRLSEVEKIRRLVEAGYSNKYIVEHVGCKPQTVYNTRYRVNQARREMENAGIGALPITLPAPKRKYTRRNAGTGITAPVGYPTVQMFEPPSLWQRIKGWFARG